MVFDSPKMRALREKYKDQDNYEVRHIILLDRHDGFDGERMLIEQLADKLASELNKKRFNKWLGNFLVENNNQHLGAWFEIMLYGWLKQNINQQWNVNFEPSIMGNNPDFSIGNGNELIVIEARGHGLNNDQRAKKKVSGIIFSKLQNINKPFFVNIFVNQYGLTINQEEFIHTIKLWLDSPEPKIFHYKDEWGNDFELSAEYKPNQNKITVASIENPQIDHEELKPHLIEKAGQHEAIRNSGIPYIIAIFLESSILSCEDVFSALFGLPTITFNLESDEIEELMIDRSGIFYHENEIWHKDVSGTLVFSHRYDESLKTRRLYACYIENPYANVKIESTFFPTEARYIVIERTKSGFKMGRVS